MADITDVFNIVTNHISNNKSFKRQLDLNVAKAVQKVQHTVTDNFSQGYCMQFATPETEVNSLFSDIPELDAGLLHDAFVTGWKLPTNAVMLRNTYYHSSMLVFIYAAMHNDVRLAEQALSLMLFRMWNGRKYKLIKFCDPDTMSYVVAHMMNKQYLPTKYNTPYEMITQYFAVTIAKKYMPYIKRDINLSKLTIQQVHGRVEQVFKSNAAPDLKTGKTKYLSGLAPLYYKAKKEGYKISANRVYGAGDDGPTVDDTFSSHGYADIVGSVVHSIITNHSPKYSTQFKAFIKHESNNIRQNVADIIMMSFYTSSFKDHLTDIISLILKITKAPKAVVCSPDFMKSVKKLIISSKHNSDVMQVKQVSDALLTTVFATEMETPVEFDKWSKMSKSQFRKILIYSIAYNIPKVVCK